MSSSIVPIHEKLLIPDLLRSAPHARHVLDRYGLHGCGGPLGPVESLGFFAKAHDVPLGRLLEELRATVDEPAALPPPPVEHAPTGADQIYRPFFKLGIAIVLSLGAAWGAYLLLRIGFTGSFSAAGIHEVNAHGHAQIYGWIGLFVMGFAYQAFPRFKHTALACPSLARASFWLMAVGILARSLSEPFAVDVPPLRAVAIGASLLEVVAIAIFASVIGRTWRASGKRLEFYDYYILSSLTWFLVQAVYETAYLRATLFAAGPAELVALVATWQGALREIQIHGFALLMVLGVSQRVFHNFYGLPAPNRRLSAVALICLNLAVGGEVIGLILMRTAAHAWAGLWYLAVLLLAGSVSALVSSWRIFSPPEETDRSLKFLRTAYIWLFVSLGMLLLVPVYQFVVLPWAVPASGAARLGFSHAYYGAIRHAITVGFLSLMIVGMAAKVVPTLNGVDVHRLPALWLPFGLINAGCLLRVTAQTLTDFTPTAFRIVGVSGLLEVAGLAVWGVHLWSIMAGRANLRAPQTACGQDVPPVRPDQPLTAAHRVGEVLEQNPELLDVLVAEGFQPLANPLLRRTLARNVTLGTACRLTGKDPAALLDTLNRARRLRAPGRLSLPVLGPDAPVPRLPFETPTNLPT